MEEFVKGEYSAGENIYENIYYVFSDEERNRIIDLVKMQKPDCQCWIDSFIFKLEIDCQWLLWIKKTSSKLDHDGLLRDGLKSFEKSIKILKKIVNLNFYIPMNAIIDADQTEKEISHPVFETFVDQVAAKKSVLLANNALEPMEHLVKILKLYQPQKTGNRQRISTKFIRQFSETYRLFIGEPTQYRDGLFFDIVRIVFEIVGIPHSDPSKAIKAALQE